MAEEDQVPTLVEVPQSDIKDSYRSKLTKLLNTANLQYSLKKYNEASELYSQATELQAELNGEMAPENAHILYLYGRCLYKVAVAKSDVLGGQVAAEKKKGEEAKKDAKVAPKEEKLAGEIMEAAVEAKDGAKEESGLANKPYFEILGDENWDTDSDDEDAEAQVEEAVEEEDDFANAYEILDVARVLLQKQIEALESAEQNGDGKGKGKAKAPEEMTPEIRQAKEKLADTYDLQAEISLENEKFLEAVGDSQNCAALKDTLYPIESSLIAEAHYKVSLALEFASVTAIREAQAKEGDAAALASDEKPEVDEKMREEAAKEMELAIASCKARLAKEKENLAGLEGTKKTEKEEEIKEVSEITEDMEQRLIDLRGPVITMSNGGPAGAPLDDPMSGLLAQILGESPADQKAKLEEATKNANDLSGLVRKKKPKPSANGAATETSSNGNGKRKLEDDVEGEGEGKKAKIE